MTRFLGNAVIAVFGAAVVLTLWPKPTRLAAAARRAGNRTFAVMIDAAYRAVDAIADRRARRRATRHTPDTTEQQEGNTSEQHPTEA